MGWMLIYVVLSVVLIISLAILHFSLWVVENHDQNHSHGSEFYNLLSRDLTSNQELSQSIGLLSKLTNIW